MADFDQARALLREFKGDKYLHGLGVLPRVGQITAELGKRAALVRDIFPGADTFVRTLKESLAAANVELLGEIKGAGPNAPRKDMARITAELTALNPNVIVSFGGGSTIDATKAAEVLRTLGGSIEDYFAVDGYAGLAKVLSMDPDAAVQFLTLLCRLLCRRLRAMNERLVAWRVMAGHEPSNGPIP